MLYRMYRQTRSKNTIENKMQNFNNTKKAALDIARAVTAKVWYKVIKDVWRIKQYKCTLCHTVSPQNIEQRIDVGPPDM